MRYTISFIIISFLVLAPATGFLRMQKSVITSAEINGDILTVSWNQVEPIKECYVELTPVLDASDFLSPGNDTIPCLSAGPKSYSTDIGRFLVKSTLYTVMYDIEGDELVSNYVMVKGEPGKSHSPPNTPPVHIPLVRVFGR